MSKVANYGLIILTHTCKELYIMHGLTESSWKFWTQMGKNFKLLE